MLIIESQYLFQFIYSCSFSLTILIHQYVHIIFTPIFIWKIKKKFFFIIKYFEFSLHVNYISYIIIYHVAITFQHAFGTTMHTYIHRNTYLHNTYIYEKVQLIVKLFCLVVVIKFFFSSVVVVIELGCVKGFINKYIILSSIYIIVCLSKEFVYEQNIWSFFVAIHFILLPVYNLFKKKYRYKVQ